VKENAIFQGDPIPYHVSVLDGHIAPNNNAGFNEAMTSHVAVSADGNILHHMRESPNASALANLLSFHYCSWMYEHTIHEVAYLNEKSIIRKSDFCFVHAEMG